MAGLLGRAKALIGQPPTPDAPAAAPFSLRCVCGERMEGLRRREAQRLACESCGATQFVFPVDPLPPLQGKPRKPKTPSTRGADGDDAPAAEAPLPVARAVEIDPRLPSADRPAKRRGPPAIMARTWTEPETDRLPAPPKPFPKKTVFAVLGLLIAVLAGGFAWRHQRIARLTEELPENARKGLLALQRGQFVEARDALAPAVAALDYGAPYDNAAAVRQGSAEAAALAELLPEAFDDALTAAVSIPGEFHRLSGKATLIDVSFAPDKSGRWSAEWTVVADQKLVRIDARKVAALEPLPTDAPVRCLAAVRFERLEKQGDRWTLVCSPGGGELLAEPRTLDLLGLGGDAKAAAALASQRKLVGLPLLNEEARRP